MSTLSVIDQPLLDVFTQSWAASRLPYSGKFSNGANFRIFRMHTLNTKIKTAKNLNSQNFHDVS